MPKKKRKKASSAHRKKRTKIPGRSRSVPKPETIAAMVRAMHGRRGGDGGRSGTNSTNGNENEFIGLGDYIGNLLKEITQARVNADLESKRLAHIYREDELLRHFPVPRVRLPNIEMQIPVIVGYEDPEFTSFSQLSREDALNLAYVMRDFFLDLFEKEFNFSLSSDGDELEDQIKVFDEKITQSIVQGEGLLSTRKKFETGAKTIVQIIVHLILTEFKGSSEANKLSTKFQRGKLSFYVKTFKASILAILDEEGEVRISPVTDQMKKVKDPSMVTKLSLSIVEEGLQWTKIGEEHVDERGNVINESQDILVSE